MKPAFANSRGDVQSKTAALHAALGVRLYLLTEFVLDQRLSKASWPAWNAVLLAVRRASERMKQQALFRLPRVYRFSVKYLVASAMITDTFILGARAGRMLAYGRANDEWTLHVVFGACIGCFLNVLAAYFVSLLVQGLSIMEMPFASDTLDMPGLSYVSAAAETSLRMVTCRSRGTGSEPLSGVDSSASEPPDIMDMLQVLNADELIDPVAPNSRPAVRAPTRHRRRRRSVDAIESDTAAGKGEGKGEAQGESDDHASRDLEEMSMLGPGARSKKLYDRRDTVQEEDDDGGD